MKNQLYTYHALYNQHMTLQLSVVEENRKGIPKNEQEFLSTNYEGLCGIRVDENEIDSKQLEALLAQEKLLVIDVREEGELPEINFVEHIKMPLSGLKEKLHTIDADTVVFICQSGKRSLQAANWLAEINKRSNIYSLKGGVLHWQTYKQ